MQQTSESSRKLELLVGFTVENGERLEKLVEGQEATNGLLDRLADAHDELSTDFKNLHGDFRNLHADLKTLHKEQRRSNAVVEVALAKIEKRFEKMVHPGGNGHGHAA